MQGASGHILSNFEKDDPPNWSSTSKALLDGLTDAEFWTDDNYNIIKEVSFLHGGKSGTDKYKIKLEIMETKK